MRLPEIGELNRRVTIKLRKDVPFGEADLEQTYQKIAEVWASIVPVGGGIYWGSKQVGDAVTHRIIMRRWPDATIPKNITGEYEIECDGLSYRVHRISDANGSRRFTVIEVEELGQVPC